MTSANAPTTTGRAAHGHSHLGIALLVISAAQLMVILDATVVNIALPSIKAALGFSSGNLTWVVNAYTLAFGGLLLLGGRAGDILGRRRVFIAGILVFTFASFLGGFANSEGLLLSARVLQGAGAAFASPTALALIATTFPDGPPRNRAFAVYAAMSGAGAAVGLIAGGLLTDYASWRWVFWINVPIGLFVAFVAPRVLGESTPRPGNFDLPGAILGTIGLTSLVYGITRSATTGWGDTTTLGAISAGVLLLVIFLFVESRSDAPLMPLRLFEERNRASSFGISFIVGACILSMFYFLSLFIQIVLGYSPVKAGFAFLPFTVGIVIGAGAASQLTPRLPPRLIAGPGLLIASFGVFGFSRLEPTSTYVSGLLGPMVVTAVGMGLTFVCLTLTAVSKVEERDTGIASGVLNAMQQVGGSLGLAVLATLAARITTERITDLAPQLGEAQTSGDTGSLTTLTQSALTSGYTAAFLCAALALFVGALIAFVALNAPKQAAPAPVAVAA